MTNGCEKGGYKKDSEEAVAKAFVDELNHQQRLEKV